MTGGVVVSVVCRHYAVSLCWQAQLFEGLDEDEASTFGGSDTFQPRRSVKKLVIRAGAGGADSSAANRSLNRSQLLGSDDGVGGGAGVTSSGRAGLTRSPADNAATDKRYCAAAVGVLVA